MPTKHDNRSFLLWLSLTTVVLAVGLAIMTAVFLRQSESAETTARLQADSVTALTFQLEREFLRFRNELRLALHGSAAPDWEVLQVRFDIFASRVLVLRDNPSTAKLQDRDEYRQLLPRLQALVKDATPLMEAPERDQPALVALMDRLIDLGPDLQALSFAANSVVTTLMDQQVRVVREQNRLIVWLVGFQVLVLLLAAAGLMVRQKRQVEERLALERLNQDLEDAKNLAEKANLAKSQFLANMSHELRTPFNGMLGMINLLEESSLTAQQRDQLGTARSSAQHLLHILNDILDMSALDAGKLRVHMEPVDLQALVMEVHQLMQSQAERKGLRLPLVVSGDRPDWVMADPTRLRQVLLNLLSNGIKFTEQGQVQLQVHGQQQGPEVTWTVSVQDSGMGMDAPTVERLFQRFERADDSATRKVGGTGLGLEISRTLAQLMGGEISVHSVPGQGSTFTLVLTTPVATAPTTAFARLEGTLFTAPDLAPAPEAPEAPATSETPPQSPNTTQPPASNASPIEGVSWQVLVAEDHPVNRKFVGLILERMGHRVTFAEDGLQALNLARENDYDIVLMDIHMPDMDGLTSTRHIRALSGPRAHVPIVALTADVMNDAQDRAREAGMDAFMSKPVQKQQLGEVMAHCVMHARRQRTASKPASPPSAA